MLKIEEIRLLLTDRNLSEISRRTGIVYGTLYRIAKGEDGDVIYSNVEKLSDYFEKDSGHEILSKVSN